MRFIVVYHSKCIKICMQCGQRMETHTNAAIINAHSIDSAIAICHMNSGQQNKVKLA